MMVGPSFSEILLLFAMLFNPGVPLGVPPGEMDQTLLRLAPEAPIYYSAWAGVGVPEADSSNATERLIAGREIQEFLRLLDERSQVWLDNFIDVDDEATQELVKKASVTFYRSLLTRGGAAYVSKAEVGIDGVDVDAGFVVTLGDDQAEFQETLDQLVDKMLQEDAALAELETVVIGGVEFRKLSINNGDETPLFWGYQGEYLLVCVGETGPAELLARMGTDVPDWLTEQMQGELSVGRQGTVCYVDLARIHAEAKPLMGAVPELVSMFEVLELDNLTSYRCVTGLDETGYVIKSHLGTDGPVRLLELFSDQPLTREQLNRIPADSQAAVALRIDAEELKSLIIDWVGLFEPDVDEMEAMLSNQLEALVGLGLDDLVTRVFNDTIYVYTAPQDGGFVTGWTLSLGIEDSMLGEQLSESLLDFLKVWSDAVGDDEAQVVSESFGEWTIHRFEVDGTFVPFVPSWCMTDDELLVSLFPQSLKSHLSRDPAAPSLGSNEYLADAFAVAGRMNGEGPRMITMVDHAEVIELAYPFFQMQAVWMTDGDDEEGQALLPGEWPSVAALTRDVEPMVGVWSKRADGYMWEVHQTLPIGDVVTSAPVLAGLSLPAMIAARLAARRIASANNLKQLGLGMHLYHDTNNRFPARASKGADGEDLLSWRVHLLPFLEQSELYEEFHLDEPWDSEHNKKLIPKMPAVFATPGSDLTEGKTNYLGVAGQHSVFRDAGRNGTESGSGGIRIAEITDGTSNSLMIVEVNENHRVIWTRPGDFEAPGMDPLKMLKGTWKDGFQAVFGDGSVRMLSDEIDEETLLNLMYIDDGMVVEIPNRR